MVCFYHPERAAVGTCRHCQRGLCSEDAALVGDVLACAGRHETEVRALLASEARAILQSERAASAYTRNAIFYGLVGAAFLAFGLYQLRWLGIQALFFLIIRLFLGYAAAANYLEGRKFR
jgi:hypothetical protein